MTDHIHLDIFFQPATAKLTSKRSGSNFWGQPPRAKARNASSDAGPRPHFDSCRRTKDPASRLKLTATFTLRETAHRAASSARQPSDVPVAVLSRQPLSDGTPNSALTRLGCSPSPPSAGLARCFQSANECTFAGARRRLCSPMTPRAAAASARASHRVGVALLTENSPPIDCVMKALSALAWIRDIFRFDSKPFHRQESLALPMQHRRGGKPLTTLLASDPK